jgi:Na+/H+ antiporter NhaD/arsenite permease-like protein
MYVLMLIIFVVGYTAIALEHNIRIDKAASALVTGILCWTIYVLGAMNIVDFDAIPHAIMALFEEEGIAHDKHEIITHYVTEYQILEHLAEISSILFFLIGAMTIVELIDAHEGFAVITDRIKTRNKVKLLWIISIITFFLSAALDNLTTTIVMVSLLRKLIKDQQQRWFFAGVIVIAANAGGAWSPIGDVTTTMLWIGGQITTAKIIVGIILPSIVCMVVPLIYLSTRLKGNVVRPRKESTLEHYTDPTSKFERNFVFFAGLFGLLLVPVYKTITHLPPFMGMMLSLGMLWLLTDILHKSKNLEFRRKYSVIGAIRKIDMPSVLFFLGILLAVGSLQSAGHLGELAQGLDKSIGTSEATGVYTVSMIIGVLSAIVDNVPLVAASMGMYPLAAEGFFMQDGLFWEFLAYCAGTGGSALIIGSAAGVAAMGIENISFGWYLKNISLLALLGYLAGAFTYIGQMALLGY